MTRSRGFFKRLKRLSRALCAGLAMFACSLGANMEADAATAQQAAQPKAGALRVLMLVPAADARLERSRIERAVPGQASGPAADAVRLALKDAERRLSQTGVQLALQVVEVGDAAAAAAAVARADASVLAVLSDLPAAAVLAAAEASPKPVFNMAAADDELRQAQCRSNLWHVTPSERMRADAIAQALVARQWTKVLLLVPQDPGQAQRVATAQAAIKRFGLKLVGTRTWKLSADPRERDMANPRLLTQGDYDAVWVVDADGEFSTSLPFRTVLPRPVVGDGGVMAVAWSARYERFGAPQVSRRLNKQSGRAMGSQDWVAWMAGKAVVDMALSADRARALQTMELDGSKGVGMAFRPWDGQLRMPMLLTDGQAVIDTVPGDGVMHPRNRLDTLGADAPEKLCRARAP